MTAIIEMLNRLAEKAPDVYNRTNEFSNDFYDIGPYRFSILSDGTLQGSTGRSDEIGRPALAWLADAIMGECEKRGWYWEVRYWQPCQRFQAEIANKSIWNDSAAQALLAAFLAAVEGER